jgi:hypothetical protein
MIPVFESKATSWAEYRSLVLAGFASDVAGQTCGLFCDGAHRPQDDDALTEVELNSPAGQILEKTHLGPTSSTEWGYGVAAIAAATSDHADLSMRERATLIPAFGRNDQHHARSDDVPTSRTHYARP